MNRKHLLVASWLVLLPASVTSASFAEEKAAAKPKAKLGADGETLVKVIGTPAPSALDEQSMASLNAIAGKLRAGETSDALATWKVFLKAHSKKLGKQGALLAGQWLVRVALLELQDDLASPADRVRFARETTAKIKDVIIALQAARKVAQKSGKPVSVKVVRLLPYQKYKQATEDLTVEMTLEELDARIADWQKQRDAKQDLAEEESSKLELVMERQRATFAALSAMMKKLSDTAQAIVQNLK